MKRLENGNYELTEDEVTRILVGFHRYGSLMYSDVEKWEGYKECEHRYLEDYYLENRKRSKIPDSIEDYVEQLLIKNYPIPTKQKKKEYKTRK